MLRFPFLLFVSYILMLPVSMALSSTVLDDQSRFIERNSEGWFFYEPFLEEPEEKKPEPPKPKIAEKKPEPEEVQETKAPIDKPLTAAWFKKNLPKYLNAAIDEPSQKNVRAFYYLQKFAMDRSARFADVAQEVVAGDPYLDHITRRPLASYASNRVDRYASLQQDKLIDRLSKSHGIFYFYKKGCEFCIVQAPVIKKLREVNNFALIPISKEGSDYMIKTFPDQRKDNGHSEMLGIKNYPATFLVSPEGKFEPLGQGAMSLSELKKRIILAAKRRGWITQDEYDSTRPVLFAKNQIDKILSSKKTRSELQEMSGQSEDGFVQPDLMIDYIYKQLGRPDAY